VLGGTEELAVEVRGLTRQFGAVRALDGVDLTIPRGAVFGLLGPNGAGKTTTVRILNGLLDPSSVGTLRVLGCDIPQAIAQVRPQVGVQTDTNLYERLSARFNLTSFGRLFGLSKNEAAERAEEFLDMFALTERADAKVETFSKGMKQKLLIARSLIGYPTLVYLDEPTAGLDPEASHELMTYIRRVSRDVHTTFFITSHRLDEMEDACTQIAILDGGRIRAAGTPREVARQAIPTIRVRVRLAAHAVLARSDLLELPGAERVEFDHNDLLVDLAALDAVPGFIRGAAALGADLLGVAEEAPTLQEAYLALVGNGGAVREAVA
jgi:ABC-2 type transport system ATP-binding protein